MESGFSFAQGKRFSSEDAHIALDDLNSVFPHLPSDTPRSLYAVFDGHGGHMAALTASCTLVFHLVHDAEFLAGNIEQSLTNAFLKTDKFILDVAARDSVVAGTCVVLALRIGDSVWCANSGDSEMVLARRSGPAKYKAEVLSVLHRPSNAEEKERVLNVGGPEAIKRNRVVGYLSVTRALGDMDLKPPRNKPYILAEPHISKVQLSADTPFFVLACDGLFDVYSYKELINFVYKQLYSKKRPPMEVADALVLGSVDKGSTDNVTALVVKLVF